jgi:hypothetical protein
MSLSKRILYDLDVTGGKLLSNDMNVSSGTVSNIYMGNASGGSMRLSGDLSVSGTLTTVNITTTNISETNVSASSIVGTNVNITNSTIANIISTNITSTNIISTNNTITNSVITNFSGGSIVVSSNSSFGSNVLIAGPILQIPTGDIASRPSANLGYIRYNTETSQFEGYGPGNAWGSLGGVVDIAQTTKVLASANPSVTDGNLYFYTVGTERVRINSAGNVGIATTAPGHLLDVNGGLRSTNFTTTNALVTNISSGTLNLSTGITSANAQITNANITTVTAATLLNTNAVSTNVSAATLNLSTGITSANAQITNANITTVTSATLLNTNAVSTNVSAATLNLSTGVTSASAQITNLNITTATVGTALATNVSATTVTAATLLNTNAVSTNVSAATINLSTGLTSASAQIANGNITTATVGTALATNVSATTVTAATLLNTNQNSTNVSSATLNLSTGLTSASAQITNVSATTVTAATLLNTNQNSTNVSAATLNLSTGLTSASAQITNANITTISTGTAVATTYTGGSMSLSGNLAIGGTLTTVNITTTNISETNVSAGSVSATNIGVTTQTVGTSRITTSLLALGNSNTVGSIFTTGGNVGIGTTAPSSKLHVNGSIRLDAETAIDIFSPLQIDSANLTQTYISFGIAGTVNDAAYLRQIGGSNSYKMALDIHDDGDEPGFCIRSVKSTNNPDIINELFTVQANGNVGIGTASPGSSLHVAGSIPISPVGSGVHVGIDSNTYAAIQLNSTVGSYIDFGTSGGDYQARIIANTVGNISLLANASNNGFVGINTASPVYTLDVNGSIQASGTNNTNYVPTCVFANNTNTANTAVASFFTPNVTGLSYSYFGRSRSTGNCFGLSYNYVGSNDAANYMGIEHYGKAGGIYLYNNSNINLSGNVGINTQSPATKLSVNGDFSLAANSGAWNTTAGKGIYMRYSTADGQDAGFIQSIDRSASIVYPITIQASTINLSTDTANITRLFINASGNIGIGTTAPSGMLHLNNVALFTSSGNLTCTGDIISFGSLSDRRLKTNIEDLQSIDAINVVNTLRPVKFKWNNSISNVEKRGSDDIGFIAQEVEEVAPCAVDDFTDISNNIEYKCIKYERLMPYLVGSIQDLTRELQKTNEELQKTNEELQILKTFIRSKFSDGI